MPSLSSSLPRRYPPYPIPTTPSSAESAEVEGNCPAPVHSSPALAHDSPSAAAADCADIPYTSPAASGPPSKVHPAEVAVAPGLASAAPEQSVVSPSYAAEPSPASPPVASPSAASHRSPSSAAHSPLLPFPSIPHTRHRSPDL